MVRLVLVQSAILSAIALAVNALRGAPAVPLGPVRALGPACLLALAIGVATLAASRVAAARFPWAQRLESSIRRMLGPLSPGEIAVLATAGPIGEELFFRGMALPALAGALGAPLAALLVVTTLFALLHWVPLRENEAQWVWPAFAFVLGLILGALFLATASLIPPLVLHVTVNAGNLPRIARAPRRRGPI
jgi:membrane protease YdiL (CAAX protease family)